MSRRAYTCRLASPHSVSWRSWRGGSCARRTTGTSSLRPVGPASADVLERGRVLARLANCHACHTVRGGEPFAGGRAISTAFGTFYSPNITPDASDGNRQLERARVLARSARGNRRATARCCIPRFRIPASRRSRRAMPTPLWEYLKTVKRSVAPIGATHAAISPYNYRPLLQRVARAVLHAGHVRTRLGAECELESRGLSGRTPWLTATCATCRALPWAPRPQSEARGANVLGWYAPALDRSRRKPACRTGASRTSPTCSIAGEYQHRRQRSAPWLKSYTKACSTLRALGHRGRSRLYLKPARPEASSAAHLAHANCASARDRCADPRSRQGPCKKIGCATCPRRRR